MPVDHVRRVRGVLARLRKHKIDLDAWEDLARIAGLPDDATDEQLVKAWWVLLWWESPGLYRDPPTPLCPTSALPGSKEKVLVMRARVERGESPCRPGDLLDSDRLALVPREGQWGSGHRKGVEGDVGFDVAEETHEGPRRVA